MSVTKTPRRSEQALRVLAISTSIATYALIIMGALVRASESGLGCPDWPLCHGQAVPLSLLQGATLIEFSHRLITTIVSLLVVINAFAVWRLYRADKWVFRPSMLALGMLGLQIILGGITVLLELPPAVVGIHLGNALLLFAAVITAAMFMIRPWPARQAVAAASDRLPRLALGALGATFLLILSGTVVEGSKADDACPSWPLCSGHIVPSGDMLAVINMVHRYIAAAVGLYILYTLWQAWRTRRQIRAMRLATIGAGLLLIIQVAVGGVNVLLDFPVATEVLHLSTGAALWASMVVFTIMSFQTLPAPAAASNAPANSESAALARGPMGARTPSGDIVASSRYAPSVTGAAASMALPVMTSPLRAGIGVAEQGRSLKQTIGLYFLLTKPWIVALLVTTTLAAMLMAQAGVPSLRVLVLTLLGGWLAASGASSLNSYIDRDIDRNMARTSQRPLPQGKIEPRDALIYGLVLSALGVAILGLYVNALSAALALVGALYYVVVYTLILKRSTPHSVEIGGLAGALPPLVGWAAVTGTLSWLAIFLALVIFLWTPPHTWALVFMVAKDYERAGVPMLPVVHGSRETLRQIVIYSLILVVVTLLPVLGLGLSVVYTIIAALLGARFVMLAVGLWRDQSKTTARRLYRYSTMYLALLFVVMVIDHALLLPLL